MCGDALDLRHRVDRFGAWGWAPLSSKENTSHPNDEKRTDPQACKEATHILHFCLPRRTPPVMLTQRGVMTEQDAGVPPPETPSPIAPMGYLPVALIVLLVLALVDAPRLQDELRFFRPGSLIAADGSAPVLQDDANNPAVDAAFTAAASRLPAGATCVIALHAWHRDYFRAAYLLMPRRIWPAVSDPGMPITPVVLRAALAARHASCLFAPRAMPVPAGLTLAHGGAYTLYLSPSPPLAASIVPALVVPRSRSSVSAVPWQSSTQPQSSYSSIRPQSEVRGNLYLPPQTPPGTS